MTKKDFIWLVIRAVGLFKAFLSVPFIVDAMSSLFIILTIFSAENASETFILLGLSGIFMEGLIKAMIAVYLLFFGKIFFNIVHHTSSLSLDTVLEKPNYTEILIRFLGVWWLWKLVIEIYAFITIRLWHAFLLGSGWLSSDDPTCQQVKAVMEKFMPAFQGKIIWSTLVHILLYSLLTWYFLKHGKFFVNLFNRLWQKAIEKDKTPVNPVNPV